MSEGADKGGSGMMEFFRGLVEDYGWKLLVMLFFAQHVVKGFVYAFSLSGTDFVGPAPREPCIGAR